MSTTALETARQAHDAAVRERKRHDPRGLKAREELAAARLLEAEELHLDECQRTVTELATATRRHDDAKTATLTTAAAFTEAREELTAAEAELALLHGRARRLGVDIPEYTWLSQDVRREHRAPLERLQRATRDGLLGSR